MTTIGSLIVTLTADSAKFEQSLQSARRRTKEMQAAIQDLKRGGLDQMAAGMTFATTQQSKWQQLSAQGSVNLDRLKSSTQTVTTAVAGSREGFRKFENAITDMGLKVVGLDGKVGRMAEGLLLMGAGGAVTLGITAGLAVIGALIRSRTDEMEELAKKAGEARKSLAEAFQQRGAGSAEGLKRQIEAEQQNFLRLQNLVADQAASRRGGKDADAGPTKELMDDLAKSSGALQELRLRLADLPKVTDAIVKAPLITWMEEVTAAAADMQFAINDVLSGGARLGRNLGGLPRFGGGASPVEEARMLAEANRQRLSDAMIGAGGVRGVSDYRAGVEALARDRQEKMAKIIEHVWISAARNIQSSFADTFTSIFNGQVKSLGDFARSVVGIVQRAIAEILAAKAAAGIATAIGGSIATAIAGGGSAVSAGQEVGNATPSQGLARANVHLSVPITVNAIDARGVASFLREARPMIARQVLQAVRSDSVFAAALRGA